MIQEILSYERKSYPTIMDGEVIRYTRNIWLNAPEVNASRNGVSIAGAWPTMTPRAVEDLIAVLRVAVTDHKRLAKER